MLLGLCSAFYPVRDLTKAKQWYTQVLGAPPYFDKASYVGFSVGGFELGLLPAGAVNGEPGDQGAQPAWGVANADMALARLLELGAGELEPVTHVGGGIKVATVLDPFGNRLGIIENPHFSVQKAPRSD